MNFSWLHHFMGKRKNDNFHMTLPPDSNLVWPPSSQRSQLAHQATSLGCGKWSLCWTVERGDLSIVISPFMCMCCSYPSYIVMWWLCVCTVYIYIYSSMKFVQCDLLLYSLIPRLPSMWMKSGNEATLQQGLVTVAVTLALFPGFHQLRMPCSFYHFQPKTGAGKAWESCTCIMPS